MIITLTTTKNTKRKKTTTGTVATIFILVCI